MKRQIESSELILNDDGSIYHLHLRPEHIADKIILVGDQGRVNLVASFFDNVEFEMQNREFFTKTGYYKGERITVLSTGIGTDNIDIVINELDALVNIDLKSRTLKDEHKSLTFVRIGTSGGLQPFADTGTYLLTEKSIGLDGMLNYYADITKVTDLGFEDAFTSYMNWNERLARPYVVDIDKDLLNTLYEDGKVVKGVTMAAPGFYGPQGRVLRLMPTDPEFNEKVEKFEYKGYKITNYEMESSALYGLSNMLGHKAATICLIIANRVNKTYLDDYKQKIGGLIKFVLDKLVKK